MHLMPDMHFIAMYGNTLMYVVAQLLNGVPFIMTKPQHNNAVNVCCVVLEKDGKIGPSS